jgi:homocitrate synthase NifV
MLHLSETRISDCTLRDARHAPGVFISLDEAVEIAQLLDQLGVDEIEAGILNGSQSEGNYITILQKLGLKSKIIGLTFCTSADSATRGIRQALDLGLKTVCLSFPTSPQFMEAKLKRSFRATVVMMKKAVTFAVGEGLDVVFTGEDAARADMDDLITYITAGHEAGASRFRFAESVACLSPRDISQRIQRLKQTVGIPIEVHCHSAYGLACANTVAAIDAGADWTSVTIDGLGERGGNTPLAPIILYLVKHRGVTRFDTTTLTKLSNQLKLSVPQSVERFAAITGSDSFNYEIGQQFAAHSIYEDFTPESVGNNRNLVFGLKFDTKAAEIAFNEKELPEMVRNKITNHVKKNRRALSIIEVNKIIDDYRIHDKRPT